MSFTKDNPAAILTDITRCTGCEECVAACKKENNLGRDGGPRWKHAVDDLSSSRYTTILRRDGHYIRQQCRHCESPACASACIVGALKKTDEGPVVYNSDMCMGCRYCMVACPYGIPRYDWDKAVPFVQKCTMCYHRIAEGKKPACTEACPEDATIFGSRNELIAEAKKRIAENPERYVNRVFGETEVGGTSVIYLSDISLGFMGWKPDLGDTPFPDLTWKALKKVPPVILGMGTLMAGTWWIIGRRMQLQAQAAQQTASPESAAADENNGQNDNSEKDQND